MPLFRRRMDNAIAVAGSGMPSPAAEGATNVHHHYAPSRVGTLFTMFVIGIVSLFLGWHAALYLADQMGYARPQQTVIQCLIGVAIVVGVLVFSAALVRFVLNDYWLHRQVMEQKRIELEQVRVRIAQLAPPATAARMTREEARQYQAVKLVMDRAYQVVDETGKLRTKLQPWSRREVGRLRLLNEPAPIGENTKLAAWVAPYLLDKRILSSDRQINLTDFPTLAAVEAQLVTDFGPPIIYNANSAGMSSHYIEKGSSSLESWA